MSEIPAKFVLKIKYYHWPVLSSDVTCEASVSWRLAKGGVPAVAVSIADQQHPAQIQIQIQAPGSDVTNSEKGRSPDDDDNILSNIFWSICNFLSSV